MSFKVEYTDKAGKAQSATFGSETAAKTYARSVKGTVVPTQVAAKAVEATVCPVGTIEAQKASTNAFYRAVKEPEVKVTWVKKEPTYDRGELMAEHFGAAMLSGHAPQDAWSDWDYIQGRG